MRMQKRKSPLVAAAALCIFVYTKLQPIRTTMMRTLILAFAALAGAACARSSDPLEYVDPFIGTGFHGHTYPGAATPFGMVQLSPDTRADDWDACAGYHYDDTTIDGFSHTHLSGTGVRRSGRHPVPSHHPDRSGARRRVSAAALRLFARPRTGLLRLLCGRTARRGACGRTHGGAPYGRAPLCVPRRRAAEGGHRPDAHDHR